MQYNPCVILVRVRVMVFSATFIIFQLYGGGHFFFVEETTDLPKVTDKLYHILLYQVHLAMIGV
jgi:hypothetical protein